MDNQPRGCGFGPAVLCSGQGGDWANSQMLQHPPPTFPQAERDLMEGGGDSPAEPQSAAPGHWQGVPLLLPHFPLPFLNTTSSPSPQTHLEVPC